MENVFLLKRRQLYWLLAIIVTSSWFVPSGFKVKNKEKLDQRVDASLIVATLLTDQYPISSLTVNEKMVTPCNIESINGQTNFAESTKVHSNQALRLSGWLLGSQKGTVPENFIVRIEGKGLLANYLSVLSINRPDVTQHLAMSTSQSTFGFNIEVPIVLMQPGAYSLTISAVISSQLVNCPNRRTVTVQ